MKGIKKLERYTKYVIIAIALILIINSIIIVFLNKDLNLKISEIKDLNKPANIQIIKILNSKCADCFDTSDVLSEIKSNKINLTEEKTLEFDSEEARVLMNKYNINKIPTIIVTGEISKITSSLDKSNDALVLTQIAPPYTALNGDVKGLVSLTILKDSSCKECSDTSLESIEKIIKIVNKTIIEISSAEGQEYRTRYNITKLPTLIFSKELGDYDYAYGINQNWAKIGTIEDDGSYISRIISPPYKDLEKDKIIGITDLILLKDSSCETCYDVNVHKEILKKYGLVFGSEKTIDISSNEGKEIINKYNLNLVPTFILSKDASAYSILMEIWPSIGTIEDDGSYVFRLVENMGVYKNIKTNETTTKYLKGTE